MCHQSMEKLGLGNPFNPRISINPSKYLPKVLSTMKIAINRFIIYNIIYYYYIIHYTLYNSNDYYYSYTFKNFNGFLFIITFI